MNVVGMCPGPSGNEWELKGNPFLFSLKSAVEEQGWTVRPVVAGELLRPEVLADQGIKVLHLHWITAVFEFQRHYDGFFFRTLKGLVVRIFSAPKGFAQLDRCGAWFTRISGGVFFRSRLKRRIDAWFQRLERAGIPVVWQVHDLFSHQTAGNGHVLWVERYFSARMAEAAQLVFLHEESCRSAVESFLGRALSNVVVTPLGPLQKNGGLSKATARERLHMDPAQRVFACVGTARPNRNPRRALEAFLKVKGPDDRMIVAGGGVARYCSGLEDPGVLVLDGLIDFEVMDQIYAAADFVISDGADYLTSGVVRTASNHGKPVIASRFGSNADMARGALVETDSQGIEGALEKAKSLSRSEWEEMCRQAKLNDGARTWKRYGQVVTEAYSSLGRA